MIVAWLWHENRSRNLVNEVITAQLRIIVFTSTPVDSSFALIRQSM